MTASVHHFPGVSVAHRVLTGHTASPEQRAAARALLADVVQLRPLKPFPANYALPPNREPTEAPMIVDADPADFRALNEWGSGQPMLALAVVAAALIVALAIIALVPVRI